MAPAVQKIRLHIGFSSRPDSGHDADSPVDSLRWNSLAASSIWPLHRFCRCFHVCRVWNHQTSVHWTYQSSFYALFHVFERIFSGFRDFPHFFGGMRRINDGTTEFRQVEYLKGRMVLKLLFLGFLVDFISPPVSAGFTAAISFLIITSQINSLLGLKILAHNFLELIISIAKNMGNIKMADTILGISSILFLFLFKVRIRV